MSSSVEDLCYWLEWLLSRGVPDLKFKWHLFDFYEQRAKFNSYCDLMILCEFIMTHAMHKTWFSNSAVTNHNKFKNVIMLGYRATALGRDDLVVEFINWNLLYLLN